ncbi:HTTM domain-containing protein [Haloarcula rubra]|uniref:HTTM domain-containing protein n=1 Tax=Haloarcula rubra TaxID=2487747 RepID=UPI002E28EF67|nr:HTTM domain-containing protein [Halomicroarcula rubra]
MTSTVREALGRRVALDRRALAAFRVSLAVVLLVDLVRRAPDLVAFYTDAGVLPRSVLAALYPGWNDLSLHALSGAAWVQVLLFVAAGLAALSLLVGYRTRLATVVSLVLLVSVQVRNPLVLNSGDVLLRRLLFWGAFLPLGSRWAVDATEGATDDHGVVGPATAGLLAQVVVVYATNAAVKLRADVWLRGDAVRYVFQLDHFTVLLGDVVAGWTPLLTLVDWLWVGMLLTSPLLVVLTGWRRAALVGAFVGAHLGMVLTLSIGVFPLVSVTGLLALVPSVVWDRVEGRLRPLASLSTAGSGRTPIADRVPALSHVARALAVCCLAVILVTNAVGLGVVAAPAGTPDRLTDRSWDMFAPSPPLATWWYEAPANLTSGDRIDALTGDPYERTRPTEAAARYPNERWRKFLDDARSEPRLRRSLAGFLCERWNRTHADGMTAVSLWVATERTDLDGPETVERERLGRYRCGAVRSGR